MLYQQGVWAMLHEARVDFSMALGLVFFADRGRRRFCADELARAAARFGQKADEEARQL